MIVLSIAGSDPSGGAGIQQDLKVATALGCYGATVITALTVQNTMGVSDVMAVPPAVVAAQLKAVVDDLDVSAVKIGMIPDAGVAQAIVETLRPYLARHPVAVVYDPVMVSTSGHRLMAESCIGYVCQQLFPLCTLITPNLPETEELLRRQQPAIADIADTKLLTPGDIDRAGRWLVRNYQRAFLLKGGHAENAWDEATDRLYDADGATYAYTSPRIETRNLHGTGCTLSSAIAARLAQGHRLPSAVSSAKEFVASAIRRSIHCEIGHGNGPLILPLDGR